MTGVRIIAGLAGGRVIAAPPAGTRPTSDRVRESLFGILDSRVGLDGLRVLDLYAGSGALGLEAVSRGAAHATLVESDARAASTIASNVTATALPSAAFSVLRRRVEIVVGSQAPDAFDVVLLDPPYALDGAAVSANLSGLLAHGWLSSDAVVVVERSARSAPTEWPAGLESYLSRTYGETRVDIATVT
ncbi:methyltransferase [Williamsia phyllosphaerae]|uniref:Methyltransferase n=1 Tax=Williamsia phyllosphaerae TaxID=885042 RepID=A0ABQ1V7S1_9NOCA|nr:16S rRNA (guanine(966)-N(2))-methyltransferase RsmD [Williamsia phyllosphaerae]GGF39529.1 methyltransferase [Williamsia phyllosphaerae]